MWFNFAYFGALYKWNHRVCFLLCLVSLSQYDILKFTHIVAGRGSLLLCIAA